MTRCEGWTRHGGAFTLGPVRWEQCECEAELLLTVRQKGVVSEQPACVGCWRQCTDFGIEVLAVTPLKLAQGEGATT